MIKLASLLTRLFAFLLVSIFHNATLADSVAGMGIVDSFAISSTASQMTFTAQGWVGSGNPALKVISFNIQLGNESIYEGHFERLLRPDVVAATGHQSWLHSGWRITANLPDEIKNGEYELHVRARLSDETFMNLAIDNPIFKKIPISRALVFPYQAAIILVLAILAVCLLYAVFVHGDFLSQLINNKINVSISPAIIGGGLIGAIFIGLVTLGITGSSLRLLYEALPFIEAKSNHIAFLEQPIRSDEWLVFTAMSIGQANHQPSFPIINKNLGLSGQNMLVVGMTGVPINHVADLAKPATWGFHLFDLKRALAWYWWLPIMGCFLALWWLFSLLLPGQWQLGAALSLLFCLSPYAVAWSNWPTYAVMLPTVALCSTMLLLRQVDWFRLALLAVLLGLSLAGFVLLLYPPWQVPLGFLYIAIAFGLVVRDRAALRIDRRKIMAFVLAALLAGTILLAWWVDARPAIDIILNTVYPGTRKTLTGGGMSLSDLLRGFSNVGALYKLDGGFSNFSEIASFYYLYIPLLIAFGFRFRELKELRGLVVALLLFTSFSVIYMIFGVPEWISELTLWSRVPSQRADLALGLAYTCLCGLALQRSSSTGSVDERRKWLAYLGSLIWTAVIFHSLLKLPEGVRAGLTFSVLSTLLFVVFISGVWLVLGDVKKYMAISLVFCAATTISFNPLIVAPENIGVIGDLKNVLGLDAAARSFKKRVLVLESDILPMALLSAGVPTVNGVFYYPQIDFWWHMGVDEESKNIFNRYQHMIFIAGRTNTDSGFILATPQPDVVKVTVDAERFNFQLTGAQVVAAPRGLGDRLGRNPSLRLSRSDTADAGWLWFNVVNHD